MSLARDLFPMFFEYSARQRLAGSERTLFVTVEEDGTLHWVDHTGRLAPSRGLSSFSFGPQGPEQSRDGKPLTPEEVQKEKEEFTIKVTASDYESAPVVGFIREVGKPWISGWNSGQSQRFHLMLDRIYWAQVNAYVYKPFDPADRG